VKARVHFQDADFASIKPQLFDPLDHHLGKPSTPRLAHVFDSALPSSRLDVRAAHRVDQGRLADQGKNDVVRHGVPFPMAREPEHPAAETPVVWSARHDDAVKSSLSHLRPKCTVAPLVFSIGEALVNRVAVVWRVDHVVEKPPVIEAISDLGKWVAGHQVSFLNLI